MNTLLAVYSSTTATSRDFWCCAVVRRDREAGEAGTAILERPWLYSRGHRRGEGSSAERPAETQHGRGPSQRTRLRFFDQTFDITDLAINKSKLQAPLMCRNKRGNQREVTQLSLSLSFQLVNSDSLFRGI